MFEKVETSANSCTFYIQKDTISSKVHRYFKDLNRHLSHKFHLLKKAVLQNLFKPNYLLQHQLPYDIRRAVSNLAASGLSSKATATEKKEFFQLSLTSPLPNEELAAELMNFFSSRGWNVNTQLVTYRKRRFGKFDLSYRQVDNISSISALEEGQEIILTLSQMKKEQ